MKLWSAILICALAFSGLNAEAARRMGGGGSIGKQSSNVTQRNATSAPASPGPSQNATNSAAKPAAAPAAAPVAPKKPWGAMLGGLAAGLGLAYLMHSMGLGGLAGGIGQFIMFAVLALGIMVAVGMFMRSRAKKAEGNSANGSGSIPFAFQGAGPGSPSAADAVPPRQYSPLNVGNDASARPWEGNATAFDSSKSMIGSGLQTPALEGASALSGSQSWGVPADFDTAGFLSAAKRNFVTLQDAWDKSDIAALRAMMTDEMAGEIKSQLGERAGHTGAGANKTDVVMLEAQLLGIEELTDSYMASVEFSGMIREEPSSGPAPFREVWNMTKAKSGGSGWLVAGVQALQ